MIMFEQLVKYNQILVSGPQRSGTSIAARMISADTNYYYIDEEEYGVYDEENFVDLLTQREIVVQCPSMSHVLHEVASEDMLIVMMIRDCDDILASEKRVGWTVGVYRELYRFGMSPRQARSFRLRGGQVAPLKYKRWREEQRCFIPHYLELEYESLSDHPLWISKEQRVDFAARQIA